MKKGAPWVTLPLVAAAGSLFHPHGLGVFELHPLDPLLDVLLALEPPGMVEVVGGEGSELWVIGHPRPEGAVAVGLDFRCPYPALRAHVLAPYALTFTG